jgi:prepilin peptidase CpaA
MTASTASNILLIVASLVLIAGLVDDLRSKKYHNWLFLTSASIAVLASILAGGWAGLQSGLMGFGSAVAIMLPLVLMKTLGAGDLKLLAAFGLAANWNTVLFVAIAGIIWGGIFGLTKVIVSGRTMTLISNLKILTATRSSTGLELHKIPFSVGLLMGWLTFLAQARLI